MKKKICFILIEMIMVSVLVCACSTGQKAEEMPESTDDAPIELTASEQSDVGTDDVAGHTITSDLNHNGVAEEVRLTDIDEGQGLQLEIWENDELIDREVGYFAHAGWTSIFLCTLDGEDYLLRYQPMMYQGACTYSYALSTLADNKETTVQWNEIDFDINFGTPIHSDFDPEAIAAFMDEINDLLSHSIQILNTDSDLLATFEKEGQLYDSLWWLDTWEPVFIRDESKSLVENLKDFQTAITAVQEPVVLEEAESMPITEPLEMAFYSGAGGWRTDITLHPDGSFVGEEWDEPDGDYTTHYFSSEPYGFEDDDWTTLKPGAQFILYSPEAAGHEPGTELYGLVEFQSWMHDHHEFSSAADVLGCWGLQNMATGEGFFADPDVY